MSQSLAWGEAGWTCQTCGAWVPRGCTHFCPTTAIGPYTPSAQPEVKWDRMSDVRIADALERIAAALERQLAEQD